MHQNGQVVITGANGFVGRWLADYLRMNGYHVTPLTREKTGEIGPETSWKPHLQGAGVVVHLAARVHRLKEGSADPEAEYTRVNVAGTERLAREAAAAGVRRLIFVSTVKVFGEGGEVTYSDTSPASPQDSYARSKLRAEDALFDIMKETGLEVVVLRPPLVYGPEVKANFFNLMKAIARGWPLPLAMARNQRSLLFVGNLADAIFRCMTSPEAAGQRFALSDGEDLSTAELARRIARALDVKPRLLPVPPSLLRIAGMAVGKSGAVDRLFGSLKVDSSGISRKLGWRPPFTVDQALASTASWYRTARGAR